MEEIRGQDAREATASTLRDQALRLAMEGRYAESEARAREALQIDPEDVEVLNHLGVAVWKQDRENEAEEILGRACQIRPDDYRGWTNLGLVLMTQGRDAEAERHFRRALELHPRVFHAQMGLGNAVSNQGRFEEAAPWLDSSLSMCPASVEALQNVAVNFGRRGCWPEAIAHYERAARLAPEDAELRRQFGYALLASGDFQRGWPEHEWRLRSRRKAGCLINRTFWNGDDFKDRTILLHFEQGYGDTLQFVRYAALVKRRGGRVVLLCPPALVRLLSRCEGVDLACDGNGFEPECQIQAPLLSLPSIFGTTLETIPNRVPYLFPDPVQVERWRSVIDRLISQDPGSGERPIRVGIAWQGRPEHSEDRWRSFRLEHLEPIADVPGVRLISLQVGEGIEQLEEVGGRLGVIELPGRRMRDFDETAAIAANLDLIIGPDSAVSHLAGGMGRPIWVGIHAVGEWRWLTGREDSPWYPSMRLFRQQRLGDWPNVFERMADALRDLRGPGFGSLTIPAGAA